MNMKIRVLLGIGAVMLLSACGDDLPEGSVLVQEKGCVACHGMDGRATAESYPNLNGQWERYLRLQLRAYRSGERDNVVMNGLAATLTDEEIVALAEFYGS